MSPSPIKVDEITKEQIRLAAAFAGCRQSEIVQRAMSEFVERHAEDFALGLKNAREALFAGQTETIAYLLDENVEEENV